MAKLGEEIEKRKPTFVALQEIKTTPPNSTYDALLALPWTKAYTLYLRSDPVVHSTTLWGVRKESNVRVVGHTVTPLESPTHQRALQTMLVEIQGACVALTTTHLASMREGSRRRLRQLQFALSALDGNEDLQVEYQDVNSGQWEVKACPAPDISILCGDLNVRNHEWERMENAIKAHDWHDLDSEPTYGWPNVLAVKGWEEGTKTCHRYDRILFSRQYAARRKYDVDPSYPSAVRVGMDEFEGEEGDVLLPSDHFGLFASFDVNKVPRRR